MQPRAATAAVLFAVAFPIVAVALFAPQAVTEVLRSRGYMPHAHCYLWQPQLVALHGVSDFLIGVSYFAISLTLAYLVYRARDHIPFHWMVLAFGLFIIACGLTHFMEVITLWTPVYWLSGDVKVVTAMASLGTAVALPPLVPQILALVEARDLATRQQEELEERTASLVVEQTARARAEEADRAKDQFLAMVSHELRNPLSPILAWSRMLAEGTLEPDKQQVAIAAIERNAIAQAQLIDDLLDVSRIVSGKLRLDVRPTALAPVITAAAEALRPSATAKGITLAAALDPEPGMVLGDPDRLQQVVWNLIANAIKFTPRGGEVRIALVRAGSHLEVSVRDTGAGIHPDLLPRVFERFWQGDASAAQRLGGLGLGLAIVRHLVESHGGEVRAHSDGPGHGSTFTFTLPVLATREKTGDGAAHRAAPRAALPRLDGVAVLVVDDDPDSNEAVKSLLGSCGAEVRVAASAAQAREILGRWRPDVLVSDIGMPGEDGYALIRGIRAGPPDRGGNLPAVALTAYARVEDRVKILTAGFDTHVTKPADPAELVTVVAAVARAGHPPR